MIDCKDTTDLEMTKKMSELKLTKVSKNYLYFKKRSRSRSFNELSPLLHNEFIQIEDHEDDSFGMNGEGQKFMYAPKGTEIKKNFFEEKKLFEDLLSPTVVTLVRELESGKKCIKKSLVKSKILSYVVQDSCKRECAVHSLMKHPNIIELYDYTEDEDEFSLYMEHANKPFYLSELIHDQHTPVEDENLLKKISEDILKGLHYIHTKGIIHGDIKLPNILCTEDNDVITVKICDFGLSHILDPEKGNKVVIDDVSGTLGHIAPEVKSNCMIGTEIDMWCFGLMLYEMAVAYKPTQMKNFSYSSGDIPFRKYDWKRKNPFIQDLISKCMNYEPSKRISAEEALLHPWFTSQD